MSGTFPGKIMQLHTHESLSGPHGEMQSAVSALPLHPAGIHASIPAISQIHVKFQDLPSLRTADTRTRIDAEIGR